MQGGGTYTTSSTSLQDLHRRVEKLLQGHSSSMSPTSSCSTSSQQLAGISEGGAGSNPALQAPNSASTSGAHSQSSLDNLGGASSASSSNQHLNQVNTGSLENMLDLTDAISSSPYLRRVASGELLQQRNPPALQTTLSAGTSPLPSPPVSPLDVAPPPPSYEQHLRQRMTTTDGSSSDGQTGSSMPTYAQPDAHPLLNLNRTFTGTNNSGLTTHVPGSYRSGKHIPSQLPPIDSTEALLKSRGLLHDNLDTPLSNPPLSPISESSSGVCNTLSGVNTRSVSAAVSDESVAGDSGVFEVSIKR